MGAMNGGSGLADAATPNEVESSLRDTAANAEPVPNALFACMQSVEIQTASASTIGTPAFKPYPIVQGFRIAASYARAIVEAANTAASIGYPASDPTSFQDALGLITDPCAAASGGKCWLRGLVGTNGALGDDGTDWGVGDPTFPTARGRGWRPLQATTPASTSRGFWCRRSKCTFSSALRS